MLNVRSIVAGLTVMLIASTSWAANCDGFTDVNDSSTFCAAVTYIKDKGITLGCTASTYCPNEFVTRLQMAAFVQRAGQGDPSNVLGDHTNTIGGGQMNTANAAATGYATVGGGLTNSATGAFSTLAGGEANVASGLRSVVGGGVFNFSSGQASTVPGGNENTASGAASFAAGFLAVANGNGCFVWGDSSTNNPVSCNADNRFVVRSVGGIFMFTGGTQQDEYTGVVLAPGASAWIVGSDRNGKEEFAAIDADDVLRKVVALPISTWKWKNQDGSIRHMGPMAQDFSAAFGLGETPKGISTVDADGVALAAIQGLNAKLEASRAVIAEQAHELAEIRAQLAAMASAR